MPKVSAKGNLIKDFNAVDIKTFKKDRPKMLHSFSCDEMLVDLESKLEGPDEFVAENMPLPANFAAKKYVFG